MRFALSVAKGIDAVTTAFGKVSWWLTVVMVLIGATNVITRYVGRAIGVSLGGTEYIVLQTYAYNVIFLLGASYVFRRDGHVRVDIVYGSLSKRTRAWIDLFGIAVFLIPFTILGLWLSDGYVARSWRQLEVNMNAGGIPIYPIKTVILIAFGLLLLQGISEAIKNVAFLRGHPQSRSMHADPPAGAAGGPPAAEAGAGAGPDVAPASASGSAPGSASGSGDDGPPTSGEGRT